PDFEDGDLDPRLAKQVEGDRRRALEEGGKRREVAGGDERVDSLADALRGRLERPGRDFRAADREPLLQPLQMRRGVTGARVARGAERGIDHGGDRSLAVGAGDDDRAEGVLGIAERRAQRRDVLEPELHPEALEAEEELDRRADAGHDERTGGAAAAAGAVAAATGAVRAGLPAGTAKRSTR